MKRLILVVVTLVILMMATLTPCVAADGAQVWLPHRIKFAPGAISSTEYGALPVNGADQWVLKISGGQTLNVQVSPVYGSVMFTVMGANGVVLGSGSMNWSCVVPATQDYYLTVRAINNTAPRYTLTVTVPPAPVPQRRDYNGTWDSPTYIVELNQAFGCFNADCPISGRLIHITAGAPEIVDIQGSANSVTGAVSFGAMIPGGQHFSGTINANSRTLSGALSGTGWLTFTRR